MAKRNRILYASESVWANGHILYRVTTLGSNTTFNSEDIFELGHLERCDVVDDAPAVAVTINTNEFGDVNTGAILAGMNPSRMVGAPTASGAYLRTDVTCTLSGSPRYYHGYSLADFADSYTKVWSPVQNEASFSTLDDDIQMTQFMDKVYINAMTLTYNTDGNATINYTGETDNKMWLVNNGKFISKEEWLIYAPANSQELYLGIPNSATIPQLSNCKYAFLSFDELGRAGISVKAAAERMGTVYRVEDTAAAGVFGYTAATQLLTLPTNAATLWPATAKGYKIEAVYAASQYATSGGNTAAADPLKDSTAAAGKYFELISADSDHYPEGVGAVRKGQIEVYLIDPDATYADNDAWAMTLRMQTVTITANPTRTPLNELGHLRPYARPMNFPIEITTATTTTASDLEQWAILAGLDPDDYDAGGTGVDLALEHLMAKQNLILVVKIFEQTDEEAGGTGPARLVNQPALEGKEYYDWDGTGTYASIGSCATRERERPLKTIVVPGLKVTTENYQLAAGGGRGGGGGAGATQEFNFRSSNKLFVVKGDVDINDVLCLQRNPSADQF